jgi:two-component system OmpR family response regulator
MADPETILVVEDEQAIASFVAAYLRKDGFTVQMTASGREALTLVQSVAPALVVLDLMLPDLDGLEVCRRIRETSTMPVLMLTARDDDLDKIAGLEVGADDYLTKPFSPRELVARVRAVLRRVDAHADHAADEVIRAGDLVLDVPRMRTELDGRAIELTPTEFTLLAALARQPGRIFTRSQLLDAVHGIAFESYERAIDTHIKNIRRKLEPDPRRPVHVLTVYGVGYRLADERA